MTDAPQDRARSAESPLERVARDAGDPELFPPEVKALHDNGEARRARKLLLRSLRFERDVHRADLQRRFAKDSRLWLEPVRHAPTMFTLNGIGTRLYGQYQPHGGTHVATLFFTVLYLPVWPIATYLVAPAGHKKWRFFAKAPHTPLAHVVRWATVVLAAGIVAASTGPSYWTSTHTSVMAFNGFDQPVIVHAGTASQVVPARSNTVLGRFARARIRVDAQWPGESAPFESLDVDLSGHGGADVLYNVADRGTLALVYVRYGPGKPREGTLLGPGPILELAEHVDYAFVDPPDSLTSQSDEGFDRSVLQAVGEDWPVPAIVMQLVGMGRADLARAVFRAELLVHPEDAGLASLASSRLLFEDLASRVAVVRSCLARAPHEVDLHRVYQDLWPTADRSALRAEYDSLRAAHPDSPMYRYLRARVAETGSEEALAGYRSALEADPHYGPAYRALAFEAQRAGSWGEASRYLDRYAALGRAEAVEVLSTRLRLRRLLHRPASAVDAVLDSTIAVAEYPTTLLTLRAHFRVARDPRALDETAAEVWRNAGPSDDPAAARKLREDLHAHLAVTAGELESARLRLRSIGDSTTRDPQLALRLALSDGATEDDRAMLVSIPGWYGLLDEFSQVTALEFLDDSERTSAVEGLFSDRTAAVAAILVDPAQLVNSALLQRTLADVSLDLRAAAYFAAFRLLAEDTTVSGVSARRTYLARARSLALPGEFGYRGPG